MEQSRPQRANIQVTADVVAFTIDDNQLKVLLIERAEAPFARTWALPGGFLHEHETSQQTARRVLLQKAGVAEMYIEQLYTFDSLDRDPRGAIMSIAYFALVALPDLLIKATAGTQHPQLYALGALPSLAFDHAQMVAYAHERLKSKIQYTNAAYSLLPQTFTFMQLQQVYEVILESPLDRRNFRKKFMSLGLIEPTGEQTKGGRHRPAELYRFVSKKPTELQHAF